MSKVKQNKENIVELIHTVEDFIYSVKYNNSLELLLSLKPNGLSDKMIARVLISSEEEVEKVRSTVIDKIKTNLFKK